MTLSYEDDMDGDGRGHDYMSQGGADHGSCGADITRAMSVLKDGIDNFYRENVTFPGHFDMCGGFTAAAFWFVLQSHNMLGMISSPPESAGRFHRANGWDICELAWDKNRFCKVGDGCCQPKECQQTVRISGECWKAHHVNYWLWGYMAKLCGDQLSSATFLTWLHRVLNREDADVGGRLIWTMAGYRGQLHTRGLASGVFYSPTFPAPGMGGVGLGDPMWSAFDSRLDAIGATMADADRAYINSIKPLPCGVCTDAQGRPVEYDGKLTARWRSASGDGTGAEIQDASLWTHRPFPETTEAFCRS